MPLSPERYLTFQGSLLCLTVSWYLGGRAEGALLVVSCIAWSALGALALDRARTKSLLAFWRSEVGYTISVCYGVVVLVLLLAPFNAEYLIKLDWERRASFGPQVFVDWLPSVIEENRSRRFGIFLAGMLVQVSMFWIYLRRVDRIERLIEIIAVNSILLALVGSAFRLMRSNSVLGLGIEAHPGFFATFRYHNHWTAFAVLSMGACLALYCLKIKVSGFSFDLRVKRPEFLCAGALFLFSITLPMTTARAGVLLMALFWIYVGCVGAVLYFRRSRRSGNSQKVWWLAILALVPALCIIYFAVWSSARGLQGEWEQTKDQIDQIHKGDLLGLDEHRTDTWADGWRILQDRPIWGAGYGSHFFLDILYARQKYWGANGQMRAHKEFMHNDWMQYLVELGIAGFSLLLLPIVYLLKITWRSWRSPTSSSHWILFGAGLILFLALFEFPLSNPAVLVHFAVLVTLALKLAYLEQTSGSSSRSASKESSVNPS